MVILCKESTKERVVCLVLCILEWKQLFFLDDVLIFAVCMTSKLLTSVFIISFEIPICWSYHWFILHPIFFIPIIKSHSCLRSSQIVGWFRWQRGEVCFSLHHHLHMSKKKGPSGGHPACDNIRLHWAVSFGQRGCEPSKIALTDLLCLASVFPELQLLNKLSLGTQGKESSTFYL